MIHYANYAVLFKTLYITRKIKLVYRFINIFTLESMSEIEFLPAMHYRRIIDFPNSQQDSFFKFLLGIHTNVLQEGSCHFAEERFDKI